MNTIHPLILPPKMFTIRQRFSFNELRPVNLIKLERGLAQRSLLYCLEKGCFSLIHYLLQSSKTDPRERDSEGRTALMYCCFIDNDCWAQNVATILLEYEAKIGDEDERGLNALHYAIITQRLILVRCYLDSLDFNLNQAIDIHGNTCLHYAASTNNIDIIRLILNAMKRYSIDLSIKNRYGLTAYDIAYEISNERCQNLLHNEITRDDRNKLPPATPTTPIKPHSFPFTLETLTDRRSSVSSRIRSTTTTAAATHGHTSLMTAPLSFSSSKSLRRSSPSTSSFNSESTTNPSSMFLDPIASRDIRVRRNQMLDLSLLNQAKSLSNVGPSSSASQNNVFNASSSTWRDDFSKIFDRLQTLKTPSYRETVHPPLSNELPSDLYQNLYGTGDTFKYDSGNYQPSSYGGPDSLSKFNNRRRASAVGVKFIPKLRK